MKKILMLLQAPFPPDIRAEREIKTLSNNGYEILILCNQYEKNKIIPVNYCQTERVKAIFESKKINKIINFPFFLNPRYIYYSIKAFWKFKPDIVHAHDLPMVPLVLILKLIKKIPIVYDMHENYPEALKYFEKKGIINFIFKNYRLARPLDRYCTKRVDKIIVVADENKERIIQNGIDPNKIFIVSNTIDIEEIKKWNKNTSIKSEYINNKILLYSGMVSPDRGLNTAIKALKLISEEIKNIKLLIVGDGPHINNLKMLAKKYFVENFVNFISWPGHDKLISYWEAADIGIIPQPYNDFINTTIPNKLFEYMYFKKPVLVSDAISLKRIIDETGAGEVFKSHNEADFADKAIEMLNNSKDYGVKGYIAVTKKYNWSIDEKELLRLYKSVK